MTDNLLRAQCVPLPHRSKSEDTLQVRMVHLVGAGKTEYLLASQLLTFTPWEPPRQCAWCGLVQSGLFSGKRFLHQTNEGLFPFLCPGYSHGICLGCSNTHYPTLRRRLHTLQRQEERTQQLREADASHEQQVLAECERSGACA